MQINLVGAVIILALCLLTLALLFGCTENTKVESKLDVNLDSYKEEIYDLQNTLTEKNSSIIELQEANEFLRKQKEIAEKTKVDLQDIYNKLWTDTTNCYWANVCSYDPKYCEKHFEEVLDDWTGQDIYNYYSNLCDGVYRDWDEYNSFDTGVVE